MKGEGGSEGGEKGWDGTVRRVRRVINGRNRQALHWARAMSNALTLI